MPHFLSVCLVSDWENCEGIRCGYDVQYVVNCDLFIFKSLIFFTSSGTYSDKLHSLSSLCFLLFAKSNVYWMNTVEIYNKERFTGSWCCLSNGGCRLKYLAVKCYQWLAFNSDSGRVCWWSLLWFTNALCSVTGNFTPLLHWQDGFEKHCSDSAR